MGYVPSIYYGCSNATYRHNIAIYWLDSTRLADLRFLNQNGICCDVFWVPTVILQDLKVVACLATRVPMHFCWFSAAGPIRVI